MELQAIQCPFSPRVMVVTLQIALCAAHEDNQLGAAVMAVLPASQRIEIFRALEWYRDHPEWDRVTYADA